MSARNANSSAPTNNPVATAQPTEQLKTEIWVTARQLEKEYKANEVKADDKYKGKILKITGLVNSIQKDVFNKAFIGLEGENPYMPIHAYVSEDQTDKAKNLRKGEKIIMVCQGGGASLTVPVLQSCTIDR